MVDYLFRLIYRLYRFPIDAWPPFTWPPASGSWLYRLAVFSIIFDFILLGAIIALLILNARFRSREFRNRRESEETILAAEKEGPSPSAGRWQKVSDRLSSVNPSDWRLAIIEADNILDELVKKIQPEGADLGERLKKIEPSDFDTLEDAWEAHKVRNRIVHESDFVLSHKEARAVVDRYKRIFEEFDYI